MMLNIEEILGKTIKCMCLNEFEVSTETYIEDIFDSLENESTSGDIEFTEVKCGETHLCPSCKEEHKVYVFPWNLDSDEIYVMLENGTFEQLKKVEAEMKCGS